jgi:hypothetical protein
MTPADATHLQDAYRREAVSLLRYARGAAPYAAGDDRKLRTELFRMGDQLDAALDTFAAFLDARRVPIPPPGAFPAGFTDYNCVAVRHLLPKVAADRARAATDLSTASALTADPAAREAVFQLAGLAARHRDELTGLA